MWNFQEVFVIILSLFANLKLMSAFYCFLFLFLPLNFISKNIQVFSYFFDHFFMYKLIIRVLHNSVDKCFSKPIMSTIVESPPLAGVIILQKSLPPQADHDSSPPWLMTSHLNSHCQVSTNYYTKGWQMTSKSDRYCKMSKLHA